MQKRFYESLTLTQDLLWYMQLTELRDLVRPAAHRVVVYFKLVNLTFIDTV